MPTLRIGRGRARLFWRGTLRKWPGDRPDSRRAFGGLAVEPRGLRRESRPSPALTKTHPVAGKVAYQNRPLTRGRILFESDTTGRESYGDIGPDGSYSLKTGTLEGAGLGKHRIALMNTTPALPSQYASVSSSKIEVDVEEGKTDYPINIP